MEKAELTFRLPELRDREILEQYIAEHLDIGETDITASMDLATTEFSRWVKTMQFNSYAGDPDLGRTRTLLCFDGDTLVGFLGLRLGLQEDQRQVYGDVGYGVRPSCRRKGYALAMMDYAREFFSKEGFQEIILGCYKDNIASARTIVRSGGILYRESDSYTKGRMSQYYSIPL